MSDKHYFSEKPCPKGHVGLRYKSSSQCVQCTAERRAVHTAAKNDIYQANRRRKRADDPAYAELVRQRNRQFYQANKSAINAQKRARWETDEEFRARQREINRRARSKPGAAERQQKYFRKWRYGLSDEQYQQMLAEQGGACAICKKHKKLVVDHCHTSGAVRALLCTGCNSALGHFEEDAGALGAAVAYLERFASCRSVITDTSSLPSQTGISAAAT